LINKSDLASLKEWSRIRTGTFKTNLAAKARISFLNGKHPKALLDGNCSTYWTTNGTDTTAVTELTLPDAVTFDVAMLQENITIGQSNFPSTTGKTVHGRT